MTYEVLILKEGAAVTDQTFIYLNKLPANTLSFSTTDKSVIGIYTVVISAKLEATALTDQFSFKVSVLDPCLLTEIYHQDLANMKASVGLAATI